ncbi:protein of unknown function [Candidatus Nitrosotalea okcheonensis]|uniref:Uncharacterized protein n=1 Tax=Candidatus Nitrosotalea okcheonensis TaxID=1903276 RepID=A0A2H1FFP6_9ARCH|nr:protein of unknown function [Candidatus Nitrosotalea okcheonensis]
MDMITNMILIRNFFMRKFDANSDTRREIPNTKKSSSMFDSEIDRSLINAGSIAKNTPKLTLENKRITITVGNFIKCFADAMDIIALRVVFPSFDNINEEINEVAITNAATWKSTL